MAFGVASVVALAFVPVLAPPLMMAVVVLASLRAMHPRQRGARHSRDAERDREQQEGFAEGAHGHEQPPFFHNGARPATPTVPLACDNATSERTSSYCARVRLRRACVSADCDSSRSVVVAAPALSAASVTR